MTSFSYIPVCADGVRRHGSYPSQREADHARSWTPCPFGTAQQHRVDAAGDAHRRGGECIDPKGFDQWETPTGLIWGGPSPDQMAALRAARRPGSGPTTEPGATPAVSAEVSP